MSEGYVYILINPSLKLHRYKIGMTRRTPEQRAAEISGATGVPEPYEVVYSKKVVDCLLAERLMHDHLNEQRVSSNREFYDIELQDAVELLNVVAKEVGVVEVSQPSEENSSDITTHTPDENATGSAESALEFEIHIPPPKGKKKSSNKRGGRKTIEEHLSICMPSIRDVFNIFSERVKSIDPLIKENSWSYGVAYKAGKNFVEMYFRTNRLEVCLRPTTYSDPENRLGKVPDNYKWTLNRRFLLDDASQVDYLMNLIRQSYNDVI